MGYKNIQPNLLTIGNLSVTCGLFKADTKLNNGYGCESKSKLKSEVGKCYAFDCPLANLADVDDFKNHDADLYEEYKNGEENTRWMIQYRKVSSDA